MNLGIHKDTGVSDTPSFLYILTPKASSVNLLLLGAIVKMIFFLWLYGNM